MQNFLRILMTNLILNNRTGTETAVRDLAFELKKAGHEPLVYSPHLGDIAREIGAAGVVVTDCLRSLPRKPDIIHGHHRIQTLQALVRFPSVPAIFVCHDRVSCHDSPPLVPGIRRYLAVDLNCRERVVSETGLREEKVEVILNSVDLARFRSRPPLPPKPRKALIFSNYASREAYARIIAEACSDLGITLDVVGEAYGNQSQRPEDLLPNYDFVFAKARAALEAMAVGCSVILCDTRGLGSLVTSDKVAEMRPWNFGMRLLTRPITPEAVRSEIMRYDPAEAAAVQRHIREHAGVEAAAHSYVELYRDVCREGRQRDWKVRRACVQALQALGEQVPLSDRLKDRGLASWLGLAARIAKGPRPYLRQLLDMARTPPK